MTNTELHHVVIVGGGFGGLQAARALRRAPVRVTLVDRRNFHLFQPLLYQVATGALSPANISGTLRAILRRQRNCEVLLGEVVDFDVANKRLVLADGELVYDSLIVAAGSRHSYFGHDEWEPVAPGLKSIEDATDIRRRIYLAFEAAERETNADRRREWLTFVIVGAGPTGVELAGALAEVANHTLRRDFRHIDPSEANIVVVDAGPQLLGPYAADLAAKARATLERRGVIVRTDTLVTEAAEDGVVVKTGDDVERIPTRTILWAAGVQASPLGKALAKQTGVATDRAGRLTVQPDLTLEGHPEISVVGDLALCTGPDGRPLPGVAQVAMQGGAYAAKCIADRLKGRSSTEPFRYRDRGSLATIGRYAAVAEIGGRKFSGFFAWVLWLVVHVMQLSHLENRILVTMQWAWNFLTFSRSARLITGPVVPIPTLDRRHDEVEAAGDESRPGPD